MPRSTAKVPERDSYPDRGANDSDEPPADAIPFTDLAVAMGVDENTLLQRLAEILAQREDDTDDGVVEGGR